MDCLNNIIGLSETTCNCEGTPPAEYNESKSGIFLDQLEGIELKALQGAESCEDGGLWDLMTRARRNGINEFTSDLLACVQQTYRPRKSNWTGILGQTTFNSTISPATTHAGIKVNALNLKGAYMTVKRIGVLVNYTGNVTIKVFSNENLSTLIQSYVVPAVANTLTWFSIPVPLELPLWSYNVSAINYYVLLDLTSAPFLPLNNKKDCNCGGNSTKPYLNWIDFIGGKTSNINDFSSFQTSSNKELFGLVLDAAMTCKMAQVICTDEEPLDFENDGYAKKMAYAIRFKAGQILLQDLYNSPNINRFTLMDRERLVAYIKYYGEEYSKWIDFLCQNVQIDNNCCYVCKNDNGLIKTRLLV